ncbi:MAG TPA: hypothetical protein VK700_02215 [Steroidobacteraceae bacterium]|jgi:hypothetical protein|nr:hypothetical protein [Steroidobacteraceae bacterium]
MLSRGARAERQANLRLLESLRVEIDEKRKQLESRHAAIPALTAAQAERVVARIVAMSADAVWEYFQPYPLRMAGKNPFYYCYGPPCDTRHDGDPELAAAVEAANLALCAHDHVLLDLRIAEFFNGCISWTESRVSATESAQSVFALDMFACMVSIAKTDSFYRSLEGKDVRDLDRENLHSVKADWLSFVHLSGETDVEPKRRLARDLAEGLVTNPKANGSAANQFYARRESAFLK